MKSKKKITGVNLILVILIMFANIYLANVNLTNSKYVFESIGNGSRQYCKLEYKSKI